MPWMVSAPEPVPLGQIIPDGGGPDPHIRSSAVIVSGMDIGRAAYEAYAEFFEWKSAVTGDRLPSWDDLDLRITIGWDEAALAAIREHEGPGSVLTIDQDAD